MTIIHYRNLRDELGNLKKNPPDIHKAEIEERRMIELARQPIEMLEGEKQLQADNKRIGINRFFGNADEEAMELEKDNTQKTVDYFLAKNNTTTLAENTEGEENEKLYREVTELAETGKWFEKAVELSN